MPLTRRGTVRARHVAGRVARHVAGRVARHVAGRVARHVAGRGVLVLPLRGARGATDETVMYTCMHRQQWPCRSTVASCCGCCGCCQRMWFLCHESDWNVRHRVSGCCRCAAHDEYAVEQSERPHRVVWPKQRPTHVRRKCDERACIAACRTRGRRYAAGRCNRLDRRAAGDFFGKIRAERIEKLRYVDQLLFVLATNRVHKHAHTPCPGAAQTRLQFSLHPPFLLVADVWHGSVHGFAVKQRCHKHPAGLEHSAQYCGCCG